MHKTEIKFLLFHVFLAGSAFALFGWAFLGWIDQLPPSPAERAGIVQGPAN